MTGRLATSGRSASQKDHKIHERTGILDFERGRADEITPYPWLDDTALGSWFYVKTESFKSATQVIGIFADIVAKNGCMMLDIGPKVDGTLPQEEVAVLLQIGEWLKTNGEAIYGTRPWKIYGEGPTRNVGGGSFSEKKDKDYTAQDIRFTTKADSLYAIFLSWPGSQATVHTLSENESLWFGRVQRVTMLGLQAPLKWRQDGKGLQVELPDQPPGNHAYVLKIS